MKIDGINYKQASQLVEITIKVNEFFNDYQTTANWIHLDNLNSTYYVGDSCIDAFSDQLEKWFTQAKEKSKEYKTNLQIKELEAKLKDLKG